MLLAIVARGLAGEAPAHKEPGKGAAETSRTEKPMADQASTLWHYGAYLDLSYPIDFNFPKNRRWRSKVTTQRVNELTPNMVLGYVRKDVDESSRWGWSLESRAATTSQDRFPMLISDLAGLTQMLIPSATFHEPMYRIWLRSEPAETHGRSVQ